MSRQVEEVPSGELAPRLLDDGGAVLVEAVSDVPACVACEAHRIARKQIEVLGEREDAASLQKALLDALGDGADLAHDARLLCHGESVGQKANEAEAISRRDAPPRFAQLEPSRRTI